jgi:small-conductance mechanosensitive channel
MKPWETRRRMGNLSRVFSAHNTLLAIICMTFLGQHVLAQSQPRPAPAGLTQQQFDEIVTVIGQSVIKTLTEKGLIVGKPAPAIKSPDETDDDESFADHLGSILLQVPATLKGGYPKIWANLSSLPARLDRDANNGRGLWVFSALVAAAAAFARLTEFAISRLTAAARVRQVKDFAAHRRLSDLFGLAVLEALAILGLYIVAHLLLSLWFGDGQAPNRTFVATYQMQQKIAQIILNGIVTWRFYLFIFRLLVRPESAPVRIAPISDQSATDLFRLFGIAVATAILTRAWVGVLVTPGAIAAAVLTNSVIVLTVYILVILRSRKQISEWFLGLIDKTHHSRIKEALATHWIWIAIPIVVVLAVARIYGGLTGQLDVPVATLLTLNILLGLFLVETLHVYGRRHHWTGDAVDPAMAVAHPLAHLLVRIMRVTLFVAAAAILIRTWAVEALNFVGSEDWNVFSRAWASALTTALLAYFAWEAVRLFTSHPGTTRAVTLPGQEADSEETQVSATRIQTLMPILRIALGIAVATTAVLMILTSFGVNITPLIAGASVIGLAISFGSQTLVRDIVSGIFYLADDAFRVGEYIDCGKAKGTVEGFTLRSIRLRHQNGQIHTIPFGQLGQITDFSRDWSTVKFNLRFARDTDPEKLRKVTKKVGLAMLEDPEFKDDFLSPLKLQGIADIADNALVMRFKFTVKPIKPTLIQREAVKRLIAAFKDAGVEFASATVAVQTIDSASAAAAAASVAASKPSLPSAF